MRLSTAARPPPPRREGSTGQGARSVGTVNVTVTCSTPTIVTAGVVLSSICRNRFRVRNPDDAVSESFFEAGITGTVRLSFQGIQIQVEANGGVPCAP